LIQELEEKDKLFEELEEKIRQLEQQRKKEESEQEEIVYRERVLDDVLAEISRRELELEVSHPQHCQ
jgi:hypothetical protein